MRGDKVMVKLHNGNFVERTVWQETQSKVIVTSQANYEKLLRGIWEAMPIGFPVKDVQRPVMR